MKRDAVLIFQRRYPVYRGGGGGYSSVVEYSTADPIDVYIIVRGNHHRND